MVTAAGAPTEPGPSVGGAIARIAGLPVLKGLILYGAVATFVALYADFMVRIWGASGKPPAVESALISAAAALAGVLGSAFALEIGTTTDANSTNQSLATALEEAKGGPLREKALVRVRQALSIDPARADAASWPKTFGIWAYAVVAGAVAVTYVFNQTETPSAIKALAVAFGGYVVALVTSAYKGG